MDFLLAERSRQGMRDRGEVEAVVQASEFGATVIVDDPWGRDLAAHDNLEFHGTLWVLQQFHQLELLSSTALRNCFASLHSRGLRLPWDIANEFLLGIGQNPL